MRQAKQILCAVAAVIPFGLVETPANAMTAVDATRGSHFTEHKPKQPKAQRAKPLCKQVCILWGTRFVGSGRKPVPVCRKRTLQCPG
jgi:hypothetical protein